MKSNGSSIRPWYKEPWPWLLMVGPATVIVAGIVTIWIAVAYHDEVIPTTQMPAQTARNIGSGGGQ